MSATQLSSQMAGLLTCRPGRQLLGEPLFTLGCYPHRPHPSQACQAPQQAAQHQQLPVSTATSGPSGSQHSSHQAKPIQASGDAVPAQDLLTPSATHHKPPAAQTAALSAAAVAAGQAARLAAGSLAAAWVELAEQAGERAAAAAQLQGHGTEPLRGFQPAVGSSQSQEAQGRKKGGRGAQQRAVLLPGLMSTGTEAGTSAGATAREEGAARHASAWEQIAAGVTRINFTKQQSKVGAAMRTWPLKQRDCYRVEAPVLEAKVASLPWSQGACASCLLRRMTPCAVLLLVMSALDLAWPHAAGLNWDNVSSAPCWPFTSLYPWQRSQQWQRPQCDTQQQQQQEQEHVQSASAGYTSQHGGVAPQQLSSQYAAFERHTLGGLVWSINGSTASYYGHVVLQPGVFVMITGVGSRLMLRMGWSEGMGLGRHSQGRTEPLIMLRRPKNEGLGSAT
ncbi:G-patch domain-containing protein [Haematococcus lacustris]|uniref:G-patch domain-containing protein n=1 Tax=Haematococcus lacustris TaxID=44745 RepID=A0A699ZUZ2_HAELA|nr:G-patch domain-containing protein [Haematococcus lacustris]